MDRIVQAVKLPAGGQAVGEPAVVAAKPKPEFANPELRETIVKLQWPMKYGDQLITEIKVRRPTMKEWTDYNRRVAEAVASGGEAAGDEVDQPFYDVPATVINALDVIDGGRLEATVNDFFSTSPSTETEPTTSQES